MRGPSITGDGANQSVPLDRKRRQPGNLIKRGTRSLAPSRFYDLLSHFVSGDAGYLGSLGSALVLPQPTELGSIPDVAKGAERKMKVLLIDADSTIPNIALMKLSSWHKSLGDDVELVRANLPYFPNRKKAPFIAKSADRTYCSVVFEGNKDFIIGEDIVFGGTGTDLSTKLSDEIEALTPDYSIYPDNDISYGFITRGCIRNCSFCKVPKKEGYIHKVANVDDIVRHTKVKFLDNNILALPEHKEILTELVLKKIKCQFNQGLDILLVDEENSELLSKMNYLGEYIFAFDNWKYRSIIEQKMLILSWRKPYQLKFFIYINPDMPLSETLNRITWLKSNQCLPYVMRDISCWSGKLSDFFVDIGAYCNQVHLFKKMNFPEFLEKRHKNKDRITNSRRLWNENI